MANQLPVPLAPPLLPGGDPVQPLPLGAPAREPRNPDLLRLLGVAYRARWVVLAACLAGLAVGVGASRLVKPRYQVQGTIWLETPPRNGVNTGPIRSAQLLDSYAWVELLKSYAVMDSVVRTERLYVVTPAESRAAVATLALGARFRPGSYTLTLSPNGDRWTLYDHAGAALESGVTGGAVGRRVGLDWTPPRGAIPPGGSVSFTIHNPRDIAVALADRIEVRMADDGHFLSLALTGDDAAGSASTLNAVMTRFVQVAAQLKRARMDELTAVLEEQRQYAEANLRDAEVELEAFRVRTVTLPSEDATPVAPGIQLTRDPVFSAFFDMQVAREELRRDREAIAGVLRRASSSEVGLDALAVIPSVQQSPELMQLLGERTQKRAELRALRGRYLDDHPQVNRLATDLDSAERRAIPATAGQVMAQIEAREAELNQRIGQASSELRRIPTRSIEESRLERRVQIAETLYGTLRQRYEEARLAAVSTLPDLRVLDRPEIPFAPLADRRRLIVAGFALAGVFLSLAGALIVDRLRQRVRYPYEVADRMRLSVLGAVPQVRAVTSGRTTETTEMEEAFRELRLALSHAAEGSGGPLVLSVASAESGDGKSTVASWLARTFAEEGHPTVLVDADVRRGSLHRVLGTVRRPGLTDLLATSGQLDDFIREPRGEMFNFIPSGSRMRQGPTLLGSERMTTLMEELRSRYRVIIVDTPPLGAGVDAYVLATLTVNVVLVLRTGQSDAQLAEAKLSLLDRLPVHVLGAVLNAVPASRAYRSYRYIPGYAAEDEKAYMLVGTR